MNIITCIKQVPASSSVAVDEKTGVLIRSDKDVKMNPYDLFALEASFLLKERLKDRTVHAITMGPPAAKSILKEAIAMGADRATLASDVRFAGADVLSTAYTLSRVIERIKDYDIVVCGKQTTDGDTAQVGPEIAEFLVIPHVPYVKSFLEVRADGLRLLVNYDAYEEVVDVSFPCLLTIDKGAFVPRLPSYRRRRALKEEAIATVGLAHFDDQNPDHYGLAGSPTQVEKIFPPDKKKVSVTIKGSARTVARSMASILKEEKYI
ncbi:MAG: electron transfer flavoprotein subunit beta/FixA family protein [Acholeplasmataceae bacterium]